MRPQAHEHRPPTGRAARPDRPGERQNKLRGASRPCRIKRVEKNRGTKDQVCAFNEAAKRHKPPIYPPLPNRRARWPVAQREAPVPSRPLLSSPQGSLQGRGRSPRWVGGSVIRVRGRDGRRPQRQHEQSHAPRRTDNTPKRAPRCTRRAPARSLVVRTLAGARVERGSGTRGATDRTREEPKTRRAPQRAATPLLDCGGN